MSRLRHAAVGAWLALTATFAAACAGSPTGRLASPSVVPGIASPVGPPRIAVMSAFDAEWLELRRAMQVTETRVVNGRTLYFGRLAGHDVVVLLSGFSMVNAAMTTQALLDRVNVSAIVFSGIAGGVNPALNVGDVTVPSQWAHYQEMIFARETPNGFVSAIPTEGFTPFGMMFPRGTSVTARGGAPDSLTRRFWFPMDSGMLQVARAVASKATLQRCTDRGACLPHTPRIVVGGNGVSGSTFVDNAAFRTWAWNTFRADALDMETAAVAVVAYENRVPFIAFRSLSDLAGGNASENESRTFGRLASVNSAAVVLKFLEALPSPAK